MGSLQIYLILLCHGCPVPLPEAREVGHGSRDHMLWLLWGWPLVSGLGRGQTLPGAPPSVGPAWFANPGPWEVTTNLHIIKLYVLEFTMLVAAVWSGGWRGTLGIHRELMVWGKMRLHSLTAVDDWDQLIIEGVGSRATLRNSGTEPFDTSHLSVPFFIWQNYFRK